MIFIAAGTKDGRELTERLVATGERVMASVVSTYGEQLLASCKGRLSINDRPLDEEGLSQCIQDQGIRVLVDASHPYAINVSKNAMKACHREGIPYIRYERDITKITYKNIHVVHSYEEAAALSACLGKNIFLTTGSRNLQKFVQAEALAGCQLIARVLPTSEVLGLCEDLALSPRQIIAMQGPFSKELNRAMFVQCRADVIVTKNSGSIGGTDTKLEAAEELGLPVVLIDRPVLDYDHVAHTYDEVIRFVEEH